MRKHGFTIVELLVVIVVILILAGIAIASYSFWQADTATSTLTYDLKTAATAMEQERNFSGSFPSSLPDSYQTNDKTTLTVVSVTTSNFCIRGVSSVDDSITMHFRKSEGEPRSGDC